MYKLEYIKIKQLYIFPLLIDTIIQLLVDYFLLTSKLQNFF